MKKEYQTSQLYKAIASEGLCVSSETMNGYGRFWDAYVAIGEVLYTLYEQGTHDPTTEVSESASKRISLTTGILNSVIILEQAITNGFYWSASALLRQHMEALARIIHIRKGGAGTEKKSPHVGSLPFGLAKNYGRLSELAHVSSGEFLGDFSISEMNEHVASALPTYQKDWANNLLATHTVHLISLAAEIHYNQTELYPEKELFDVNEPLYEVAKILVELGHWKELKYNTDDKPSS